MIRVRRVALVSLTLVSLVAAGCGGGGGDDDEAAPTTPGSVEVADNVFKPKTIEVAAGDTVTWEFTGGALHNVSGKGFKSESQKDGSFEHTFDEAGSYSYVCTLHPGMTGKVTVR